MDKTKKTDLTAEELKSGTGLDTEQLAKLKKEIFKSLSRDRNNLLVNMPFIGGIAMRFDLIPVRDMRCLTACTDGNLHIYFNCDFYLSLTSEERMFVLAHELWHNLFLHFSRKMSRDADLFNMATDMEVNHMLDGRANENGISAPDGLLFPPSELAGKSAETIYEWLLEQKSKNKLKQALERGNMERNRKNSKNAGSGNIKGQFDKHSYSGEDDANSANAAEYGIPEDRWGRMGFDDDFKPSIPKDAADKIREVAVSAAQAYQREYGSLPAGIDQAVGKLAKPEVNWRTKLCEFVTSRYGDSRRWLPPNRRYVYNDMYFQSRRTETLKCIVCIDTSGSTQCELPKFFGELTGLVESFGSYQITCIQCDAAVDRVDVYDNDNPLDVMTNVTFAVSGGGGTSFIPPYDYIKKNCVEGDCVIYITDGYGPAPKDNPLDIPTLWVISKGGATDFCDWGEKIVLRESSFER